MTAYNRNYAIPVPKSEEGKHIPYGRVLSEMDNELLRQVAERKHKSLYISTLLSTFARRHFSACLSTPQTAFMLDASLSPTHTTVDHSPTTNSVLREKTEQMQESIERIGLHLLGQEGRILLARYIQVKSDQQVLSGQAYTLEKRGTNNGN